MYDEVVGKLKINWWICFLTIYQPLVGYLMSKFISGCKKLLSKGDLYFKCVLAVERYTKENVHTSPSAFSYVLPCEGKRKIKKTPVQMIINRRFYWRK